MTTNTQPNIKPDVKSAPTKSVLKPTWCKIFIANDLDGNVLKNCKNEIQGLEDYLAETAESVVGKKTADEILDKFAKLRTIRLAEVGTNKWTPATKIFSHVERDSLSKILRTLSQQRYPGTMKYLEYLNIITMSLDGALDITDEDRRRVARKYNNENKIAPFTSTSVSMTQWRKGHDDDRPKRTDLYGTVKDLKKANTINPAVPLADIQLYELLYIIHGYFVTAYRKLKEAHETGTDMSPEDQVYTTRYIRMYNDAIIIKNISREAFNHRSILQECTYRSWIGSMDKDIPSTNTKRGWCASERRKFTRYVLGNVEETINHAYRDDFIERVVGQFVNTGTSTQDYAI